MYNIGQWVSCEDGIGQILYIRNEYNDEFINETFFEENNVSYRQFLIIKLLLNNKEKPKKGKKIVYHQSKFCKILNNKRTKLIEDFKKNNENEYNKYLISDDKNDFDYIITTEYLVNECEKKTILNELNKLCWELFPSFTYNEFKKAFKTKNLNFDFSTKITGYSIPGQKNKIRIMYYSKMMKIVSNKMIFYYVKAIDENSLFE